VGKGDVTKICILLLLPNVWDVAYHWKTSSDPVWSYTQNTYP